MTPTWTIDDYGPTGAIFSGGRKLIDSGVAPLVAQARGYKTLGNTAEIAYWANRVLRSRHGLPGDERGLQRICNGEAMIIPWFSATNVFAVDGTALPSAIQVRAASPREVDGKLRKYEMLAGHKPTLDVHPATSREWAGDATHVLITEGVLKADSALTALLLSASVTVEELACVPTMFGADAIAEARTKLAALMDRVPVHDRFVMVGAVGVSAWHALPDWNALPIRDRRIHIAFDGDIRTNPMVHQQVEQLIEFVDRKGGVVRMLDLDGEPARALKEHAQYPADAKLGLDDFLTKVGSWSEAVGLSTQNFPGLEVVPSHDLTIHELFAARGGASTREFELTFREDPAWIIAKIGPATYDEHGRPTGVTGLYRRSLAVMKDESGTDVILPNGKKKLEEVDERLLTFVTIVVARSEKRTVSPLGVSEVEPGSAKVDLWTLTRTGQWIPTMNVPQEDAEDPKKLMLLTDVSEMAPVGSLRGIAEGALSFCVRKLGREERTEVVATPTTCLLKRKDGTWAMVLAGGSLDANGPAPEIVGVPLMGALESTGFPEVARTDEEIRAGVDAIKAFLAVNEPRVMYPQFAHFLQAWYPSDMGHGLLALVAKPGFGKSATMSVTQALATGATPKNKFTFAFTKATTRGIIGSGISARNAVAFGDDYRTSGTRTGSSLERVEAKPGVFAQLTYADSERVAGTADGGFVQDGHAETTGFMTGEQRPFGDAIQGRTIIIEMEQQTDYHRVVDFGRLHAPKARALMGRYVCDVLREMNELGDMTKAHERRNDRWMQLRDELGLDQERATELTAHMAFGYERFLESLPTWARAELPTMEQMTTVLRQVRDENLDGQSDGAVSARILEVITEWLASGAGHITHGGIGEAPTNVKGLDPRRLGWAYEDRGMATVAVAKGSRVGELSKDGSYVAITNEALKRAAEKIGHHIAGTSELGSLLGSVVVVTSKAGDKAPSGLGFVDRPRSVVVEAKVLALEPDPELLAAARATPANVTPMPSKSPAARPVDDRELIGAVADDHF